MIALAICTGVNVLLLAGVLVLAWKTRAAVLSLTAQVERLHRAGIVLSAGSATDAAAHVSRFRKLRAIEKASARMAAGLVGGGS